MVSDARQASDAGAARAFPPEPWYLGGSLLVSAFSVPRSALPTTEEWVLPDNRRAAGLGRTAIVGVAFANYEGGILEYEELLVAVPSFGAGGLRYTIPQIWVDSPESRAGGRALWGIPKQLGLFDRTSSSAGASVALHSVASLHATFGGAMLPGMRQFPLPTLQNRIVDAPDEASSETPPSSSATLPPGVILSRNRIVGRLAVLTASWSFDANGPLGYLSGRSPFASFSLRDSSIIFGSEVKRP